VDDQAFMREPQHRFSERGSTDSELIHQIALIKL
jgi:hypothetical protein